MRNPVLKVDFRKHYGAVCLLSQAQRERHGLIHVFSPASPTVEVGTTHRHDETGAHSLRRSYFAIGTPSRGLSEACRDSDQTAASTE